MAWDDPDTWTTAQFVTAALLNQGLRDNLKYLGGADGRGTTLPVSPVDGQLFVYVADATAGVEWLLKYNAGDVGSFKWHVLSGPPLLALIATSESTTSTTYAALATAGPTVTVPLAGDYDVLVEAHITGGALGANPGSGYMSFDVGATAAVDADGIRVFSPGNESTTGASCSRRVRKTSIAASAALTAKYRQVSGGASATFDTRQLSVFPIRVG